MNKLLDTLVNAWNSFSEGFLTFLPKLLLAALAVLIGFLLGKGVSWLTKSVLRYWKADKWFAENYIDTFLSKSGIKNGAVGLIGTIIFWTIFLLSILLSTQILGWETMTNKLDIALMYLPRLLSAILILILGILLANIGYKLISSVLSATNLGAGTIIARLFFYIIISLAVITALEQLGINTSLISTNFTLIIAAILIAFAISFAFGARDVMKNILSASYSKKHFSVGQKIRIGQTKGEIIRISNVSVFLKTTDSIVVIPAEKLLSETVEIMG